MKSARNKAFTLLELSIVLAIISTIIGAILLGKTLLTTSRLQTVISDADNYILATKNFKQTYQSLPGDMAGATNVWGSVSSGCTTQQGTGTLTCNGNGDGEIGPAGQLYEGFRFWQHLYNAGMSTQPITSIPSSGNTSTPGTNVPAGPFKGSGFSVAWLGTITSSSTYFSGNYGNVLFFGSNTTAPTLGGILTGEQALSIDTKIDDGLASTGLVRAYIDAGNKCIYSSQYYLGTNSSGNYDVGCALIFVPGF